MMEGSHYGTTKSRALPERDRGQSFSCANKLVKGTSSLIPKRPDWINKKGPALASRAFDFTDG